MSAPRYDFTSHRLFVDSSLHQDARVDLDASQSNYLRNVLRLPDGAGLLTFNGRDGEWRARLSLSGRKIVSLIIQDLVRVQEPGCDLHYLFAPLKHARLDYMVQKAVEMGAGVLRPVFTRRAQAERVNLDRMRANAIEAAEQCGILTIPEIATSARLEALLSAWDASRLLIFCDENAPVRDPLEAMRDVASAEAGRPLAVLIGPEGGFDPQERAALLATPHVLRLSLGPRILRADTAAVAALALAQAALGDWRRRT
ncbi:16S rRNA (uracil(1498)-N(3))-methyltransferase [Methylocapsa palsarum]|uniref:Ribosomal RNA small subunit methyltransferase E n=1 Tax=Methylocapsa palsarum TaxID=1612308 RepID=A0A1I3X144_9HYPH|nr:16S rRNA (uracil(1498)-N(3))-methyltransferase [Methylocapsa palsarum]SFK13458.1 16S rRNA (uracil1498-N3)-methyltransferase [Methylocapsa palsarum]